MLALDLRLYVVTDPEQSGARGVIETVRLALMGGATIVQLRDKTSSTRAMLEQARALRVHCRAAGVPLLINDRVDVALVAHADGVHLGQDDMPVAEARRVLGPDAIIGVSVRTAAEVTSAERDGATYVAANGVWSTLTKTDFGQPLELGGLRRLAAQCHVPMVAIGGIHEENAAHIVRAGCAGIAVVSAVMKAADPAEACRRLRGACGR